MDSMEFNKIAGAILVAGMIAMFSGFISRLLVSPTELEQSVVLVATEDGGEAAPEAVAEEEVADIGPLLASADVAAGEKVAKKCTACHSFDQGGPNKVGPNLWNVVGAELGHVDDYSYSSALKEFGGSWGYEELNKFLLKPKEYINGTKMQFGGLKKDGDRANLIAYLRSLSETPQPLPE